jgi:hypothetical protein
MVGATNVGPLVGGRIGVAGSHGRKTLRQVGRSSPTLFPPQSCGKKSQRGSVVTIVGLSRGRDSAGQIAPKGADVREA